MESNKPNDNQREVILEGKKIAIATPCYGGSLCSQYVQSIIATIPELIKYGISYQLLTLDRESIISRARNTITACFLKTDAEYLIWIDADEGWEPHSLLRLIASGKDVIGCAAPRKETPTSFCVNLPPEGIEVCPDAGVIKVLELGTGFMLIKRSVFEKMIEAEPDNFSYDPHGHDKVYNFFEPKIIDHKFWSEDYTFCQRWRALGGDVWVDPSAIIKHVGGHVWEGALVQALQAAGMQPGAQGVYKNETDNSINGSN